MEFTINGTCIVVLQGDITKQDTEAIVNAANSSLLGGGGVDGAIHRTGGPQILAECKQIRAKQGGCPTGEAVITSGGNLAAKYVIHTVGPVWRGGSNDEARLLRNAYWNSLNLANEKGIRSIAFPSISTGAYRFPIVEAAQIAVKTVLDFVVEKRIPEEIRFVLFNDRDLRIYQKTWEQNLRSNI
ncbi:O-acetyl-ADP-ribose deacetylase [Desulfotruncus alcoholivorax]|uniref:O-acetyl-ADP-ribose deacetylase n=1 Tax=Desulfotruncus alcoholivorax TaxID=265477 RepID=UPI0004108FC6|nr:O-acetyl-ADP-ribose deacetylase [Desulfotruncus alcoholivorax]